MSIFRRLLPCWQGSRCADFAAGVLRKAIRRWKLRRRDVALRNRGGFFRILRAHLELLEPRLALANGFINTDGTSVSGFFVGGGITHSFVITAVSPDSDHNGLVNTNTLTLNGTIDGPGAGQFTDTHSGLSVDALNAGTSTVIGSTSSFSGTADRATFSGMTVTLPAGQGSRNVDLRITRSGFGSVTILRSSDSTNLRGLFTVDTARPTVTINKAATQSDPTSSSPVRFTVTFSETVTGFTSGDISFTGSTAPGTLSASVTGSGSSYTVSVSGMTGSGTVVASIGANAASDASGNSNTASTSTDNAVDYDVTGPTVTINQAAGQNDPTQTSPINYSVVFSQSVTGFGNDDVMLSGTAGATTAVVTGSGANYNVAVSGMTSSGMVVATVKAGAVTDAAGNPSAASSSIDNSVTFNVPVTVTINQSAGQQDPSNESEIDFTVTFSRDVAGFIGSDVVLSGTAGATTAVVTGGPAVYNVAVSGMVADGTVIATIPAAIATATDGSGAVNSASTSADNSVTYDVTPPTVTVNKLVSQADPTNALPIRFTVEFSEAVIDFQPIADVVFIGTAGGSTNSVCIGCTTTFSVSVPSVTGPGTVIANVPAGVATDAAGNPNLASTSTDNTVTYDPVAPSAIISQAASQADPTFNSPVNFSVTFNEDVTGFINSDVVLGGTAGATTATVTGGPVTYNVAVSGMTAAGTVTITLPAGRVTDLAGNANTAATFSDNSVFFDATPPVADIIDVTPDPRNSAVASVSINFTEPVLGVDISDFTLTRNGAGVSLAGLSIEGAGANYSLNLSTVTGEVGTYELKLTSAGSGISDTTGNPLVADALDSWTFSAGDVVAPTADILDVTPDPRSAPVGLVQILFSEPVTGLDIGDLSLTRNGINVPLVNLVVVGSGAAYTVNLLGVTAGDGDYVLTLRASGTGIVDLGGNPLAANVVESWRIDATPPTADIDDIFPDPQIGPVFNFVPVFFSEPVTGVDIADFRLTRNGASVPLAGATVEGSGDFYSLDLFAVTGTAGDYVLTLQAAGSGIADGAGNPLAGDAVDAWFNDPVNPVGDILDVFPDPRNGAAGIVTAFFSEPLSGVDLADFTLTRNGINVPLTGVGFTPFFAPAPPFVLQVDLDLSSVTAAPGDYVLRLNAAGAGIVGISNRPFTFQPVESWTNDATSPTLTINQAASQADPTSVSPVHFTVTFSEAVLDFTDSDVFISGTAGATAVAVSGGPAVYDVAVFGMAGPGTVIVSIAAGAATDLAANPSAASTSTDNTVTFSLDTSGPTADIVDIAPDPRNSAVSDVTLVFNEAVLGFDLSDLRLTRDGGLNLLTSGQSLQTSDLKVWTLSGLGALTAGTGQYSLTLIAGGSGIVDSAGNPLVADAGDSWRFSSPPTITAIADQATLEDIATTAIAFTVGDDTTLSENLVLSVSSSDESLVPLANIEFGGAGASRTVTVRPAAELSGNVTITITVEDADDELAMAAFELTVKPVNDAPRFVVGPNQSAADEDPESEIAGWATGISAGPANESQQSLDFLVENDANNLFAVQPAVDSSGQLTFTPAPNANGTAHVTVRLMDSGGTDDGGVNASPPQMFQITITKPFPKHNTLRRFDVDADGGVFASDALDVINQLNANSAGTIPANTSPGPPYFDTSRDNFLSAGDALDVINFINAFGQGLPGPEGEPAGKAAASGIPATSPPAIGNAPDDLATMISLLAMDLSEQASRRRRGL